MRRLSYGLHVSCGPHVSFGLYVSYGLHGHLRNLPGYCHKVSGRLCPSRLIPGSIRRLAWAWGLISAILLTGCAFNSRLDDARYRPLGQVQPVNPSLPVTPESRAPNRGRPDSSLSYSADGHDPENLIALRYGHAASITKILQTAKIHCQPRAIGVAGLSAGEGGISLCHYRFPRHCGGHGFTLIEHGPDIALVYHDHQNQRNIVDQIADRHHARPGLWDLSDRLSLTSPLPERELAMQLSDSQWRAWLVEMNDEDRRYFGTAYARAVNEVQACF